MTRRGRAWPFALALIAVSCAATGARPSASASTQAPAVNPDAKVQHEFIERVQRYIDLRNKVEGRLPRVPDKAEPEAITAHQKGLLRAMQDARRGAKPGDIFQDRVRHLIRRLVANALANEGAAPKAAIQEENPGGAIRIAVNGPYPTTVPLATVPPQVLLQLPRLPDAGLEYRFIGRRLLLLDSHANMVIDYMERALP